MAAVLCFVVASANAQTLDPTSLTKYIDELPNPLADNKATPTQVIDGEQWYDISISQFSAQVHGELPATTFWGYNQSVPGPTFEVQRGQTIHVNWINDLRDGGGAGLPNLLPYDTSIHGSTAGGHGGGQMGGMALPQNRVVTHLHGGVTHELSDGFPFHWVTHDPAAPANGMGGPAGNVYTTHYTNNQRANALWYHDHTMGITRLNVYAGMAGMYLVRDAEEAAAGLPQGAYEVPLMIMDRSFNADGSLYYPDGLGTVPAGFQTDHPMATGSVTPAYYGHANLVNGKVWPFMNVEQRLYRFRLCNAANARVYDLVFEDELGNPLTVHQVGTDGGLLEAPVARDNLLFGSGERIDVLVDFSQLEPGDVVYLKNVGPAGMNPMAGPANPDTVGQVMKFVVTGPAADTANNTIPDTLSQIESYPELADGAEDLSTLTLTLSRVIDQYNRPEFLIGGKKWADPVSEVLDLGEMQVWEFVNQTNMYHPMHLHLEAVQVLERKGPFNNVIPLQPWELGWQDTVLVGPNERLKILVRFEQYVGAFVYHCHVLEHEDYEMMRPFQINPAMPGDTDLDGDIDDFDLLSAISNFTGSLPAGVGGKSVPDGDTDNDADVDDFDLINMISGFTGSLSVPQSD